MSHSALENLVLVEGIGKDYPIIRTGSGRLQTIFELLSGRAVHDYYRALENVSLTIARGESWGIIGENGAGKSTLMKIVAGVVKPTRGTVSVHGRTSALLELGTGFHPEYTGRENIFLASALMGWTRAETHKRLDTILAFADIGTHIDQAVKTYSSGMAVRLGFAVATALTPDILVTDEVLAVGDESFQKKCLRWMENFRAEGGTLLLCSHSMYHIQSLCQKTIWIHEGRARMQGESFAVTQAYLAYHEAKNRRDETPVAASTPINDAPYPLLASIWIEDAAGNERVLFEMNEDITLCGIFNSPEDKTTVVMAGLTRMDGTPVFGTFSNDGGFSANRLTPKRFGFRLTLDAHTLLPGMYHVRAHTLDEHGLRLFDTRELVITISGKTRDHGLVRLAHRWQQGRERREVSK